MLEEGRITYKQLILIIFLSRIIITITYLPGLNAMPATQDIWIANLMFIPLQLLVALPIYFLWMRFPNQTIIQYSQTIAGKLGKLAGALLVWYFLHQTAIILAQFSLFVTSVSMTETPVLFLTLTLVLVCAYATWQGLEVISRISELFVPLIMIAIITIFLLLAKDMNFKILTPVLGKGILPIFQGSLFFTNKTLEVLGLAMLLPYLNERQKVKTVFFSSITLIALFFNFIEISTITVLGLAEAKSRTFPFFAAIRLVNVGDFLERIESVHLAIWILGAFIKVSFQYYLAVLGLSQLLNLKNYRPLILPTGTILIPLSLLVAPSLVELMESISSKISILYSFFFILFIPSLLLLIAIIRKKGVRSR